MERLLFKENNDIAQQCPHTGGKAVFWARSLYAEAGEKAMYDDTGSCLSAGVNYRQGQASQNRDIAGIKLYPNPANTTLYIESIYKGEAILLIRNHLGQLIEKRSILNITNEATPIQDIPTGFYFYQIVQNSLVLQSGKLLITH